MESELAKSLEDAGVRFIRVLWCDNANVIRSKAIHIGALPGHVDHGVSLSIAQQAIPVMYDRVIPETGLEPVSEVWLVPDWSTLTILPYAPGHAHVIGDMVKEGQPWNLCPRNFLKRMLTAARQEGFEVMGAFENEFYLLRSTADGDIPVDTTGFCSALAMDLNQAVIDEIAEALITQGIPVELYYPESGPGQHEISVRYTHALQAADQQINFRRTVHGVAARHSLKASFLPKVYIDKAGSGCHLHLSLWQGGKNLLPDANGTANLSEIARAFIGGLLHHLNALMALTTPSPNSYRRISPHAWSSAFCCWGLDNREAAVRVPSMPTGSGPTHLELRAIDASSNPYLALGAVIAAGLDGIRRGLDPGEPVTVDPGHLPESERQARAINSLPTNLGNAIAHLSDNQTLLNALGPQLAQAFLAVRKAEWEALKDLELEDEVKLLLERY